MLFISLIFVINLLSLSLQLPSSLNRPIDAERGVSLTHGEVNSSEDWTQTEDSAEDSSDNEQEGGQGVAKREALKTGAVSLAASFAAVIGVSNPAVAAAIAIGILVLQPIIDQIGGAAGIWDQLEDKVVTKIGEKLAASAVHGLKERVLYPLNRRIKKGDKFGPNDLEIILDKMEEVIPDNPEYGWNYDLPLMMVYYLPYMIAGYHKVINDDDDYPVCALPNMMNHYKARVIYGLKEMVKKRYKAIIPDSWDEGTYKCGRKRDNVNSTSHLHRKGMGYLPAGKLTTCNEVMVFYDDTVAKRKIKMVRRNRKPVKSWASKINENVRKPAVDFLYKEVVEKINKYFTSDICLAGLGCECPSPIQRSDFDIGWPLTCYGEGERKCLFPAGRFTEDYYWCWDDGVMNSYSKTDKVDLNLCMRIPQEIPEQLNVLH